LSHLASLAFKNISLIHKFNQGYRAALAGLVI